MAVFTLSDIHGSYDRLETESFHSVVTPVSIATPVNFSLTPSKVHDLITPFVSERFENYPTQHRRGLFLLKGALSIGGTLARVPLLPLSLNIFPSHDYVGKIAASLNMIGFSSYMIYSSKDMIEHARLWLKLSSHDKTFHCERLKKISVVAFSAISGMAAQVPYFFLAWQYNQTRPYMVAFGALDLIPPIYSLYMSLNSVIAKTACSQTAEKILKTKSYFSSKLKERMDRIIQGSFDSMYQETLSSDPVIDKSGALNHYFSHLFATNYDLEENINPCLDHTALKTAQVFGFVLLSVQLAWAGYLAYQGVSRVTSQESVKISTIFYVMISNLSLTRFMLISSLYKMLRSSSDCISHGRSFNYLSDRLLPRVSVIARFVNLTIALAALMPAYTLSSDFLSSDYIYPSLAVYGLGLVILNYLPLRSLTDDLMLSGIKIWGDHKSKQDVAIYNHTKHLKYIIDASSEHHIGLFLLKNSDQSAISQAMSKFDLSQEELYIFLKRKKLLNAAFVTR